MDYYPTYKWHPNEAKLCPKCHEKKLKRDEKGYKIAAAIFLITGILAIPVLQSDQVPSWAEGALYQVLRWTVIVFVAALTVLGIYDTFDPEQSYKCRACGYKTTIERAPFNWLQKMVIGIMIVGLTVFAILILALAFVAMAER